VDGGGRPGTVAHLARRVHRRRRLVALAGATAVVVAALGGAAVGGVSAGPVAAATRLAPVHGSHVSAQLTAAAVPWGTKLAWSCTYPSGGGGVYTSSYRLVVTTTTGSTSVVATWRAHGAGATGLAAATSIPRSAIRAVEIRTETGAVLARADLAP
jgi:hypothetical protein